LMQALNQPITGVVGVLGQGTALVLVGQGTAVVARAVVAHRAAARTDRLPEAETVQVAEEGVPQERREVQVGPAAAGEVVAQAVGVVARVVLEESAARAEEAAAPAGAALDLDGDWEEDLEAVGVSRPTMKSSRFCER
jgi:hypothetical protein